MRDWMYVFSICVIIFITYRERNEEKKKKEIGRRGIFVPNDGNGSRGTIFIFSNKSTPSMSFPSRSLFFVCMYALCLSLFLYSTLQPSLLLLWLFTWQAKGVFCGLCIKVYYKDTYENAEAFKKKIKEKKEQEWWWLDK
jgi:hypothetical protein